MSDIDAIVAQSICEAIDSHVGELAADEATITKGMVLAVGLRLAEQEMSREGAQVGLETVTEHLNPYQP